MNFQIWPGVSVAPSTLNVMSDRPIRKTCRDPAIDTVGSRFKSCDHMEISIERDGNLVPFFPFRLKRSGDNGTYLVRNHLTEKPVRINRGGAEVLRLADGQRTLSDMVAKLARRYPEAGGHEGIWARLQDFFQPLSRNELLWWREVPISPVAVGPPENMFWEITARCNLRCRHCVVGAGDALDGELTTARCLKLAEEMASFGVESIAFSGGEPLIHPDFKKIAARVHELGMEVQVATNGTLVDMDLARWLHEIGAGVQVSLDGSRPEIHDFMRPGSNAFERTIKGIETLVAAGNRVTIGTVLTSRNLEDIPEILELAIRLGAVGFRLIPFVPKGRGQLHRDLEVPPERVKDITLYLRDRREHLDIGIAEMEFEEFLDTMPCQDPVDWNRPLGCGGAVSYGTITPTGEVLPCHFFEGVRADTVVDSSFDEVWQRSRFLNYFRSLSISDLHGSRCRSCSYLSECGGSCRAANFAKGDLFGNNPQCWISMEGEQGPR